MVEREPTARPKVRRETRWQRATLYTHGVGRVPMFWTPDPEHSPILRMLRSGEEIEFVPEIKYDRWIVSRVEHQIGWLDLDMVRLMEYDTDQTQPKKPAKPPWLEEVDTAQTALSENDIDTLELEMPKDIRQHREATPAEAMPELEINAIKQSVETPAASSNGNHNNSSSASKNGGLHLSSGDVRRLIGHFKGIRDILNNAFNRNGDS